VFSTGTTIIASQHNTNNSVIFNDYNGNITDANIAANAAIEYTKLSLNNSIRQSDILSSTVFLVANIPTLSYSNITQFPYIKVSETQTSGTQSGSSTSGSWITRVLNTKDNDTASIATLVSGTGGVTLPIGTYLTKASAPFVSQGFVQIRLQNLTTSTTLIIGQNSFLGADSGGVATGGLAFLSGQFVLSASNAVAVQYQVGVSHSTEGLGAAASFGTEVYTVAEFTKVA
jgi:hypothetical protein